MSSVLLNHQFTCPTLNGSVDLNFVDYYCLQSFLYLVDTESIKISLLYLFILVIHLDTSQYMISTSIYRRYRVVKVGIPIHIVFIHLHTVFILNVFMLIFVSKHDDLSIFFFMFMGSRFFIYLFNTLLLCYLTVIITYTFLCHWYVSWNLLRLFILYLKTFGLCFIIVYKYIFVFFDQSNYSFD